MNGFLEKDMHPFLVAFAKKQFNSYSKTIDQSKSKTSKAGENEWIHPDIVSFRLTRNDFNPKIKSFYRQMNQDVAYLYSFELKCSIKLNDLKKKYFQAVSNSSWANEGYLVTVELNEKDKILMEELERLVSAFGVGIIKLDLENVENSRVLFDAQKKEQLDFYTINKLISQENADFIDFIEVIDSCLEAKGLIDEEAIIKCRMDEIHNQKELKNILKSVGNEKEINQDVPTKSISVDSVFLNEDEFKKINEKNFSFTKLEVIQINGQTICVESWRQGLIELFKYCQRKDSRLFDSYCFPLSGSIHRLFLRDNSKNWNRGEKEKFAQIDEITWSYVHLSVDDICRTILKTMEIFGLSEEDVLVKIKNK